MSRKEEKETVGRGLVVWTIARTDSETMPIGGEHDSTLSIGLDKQPCNVYSQIATANAKWTSKVDKTNVFLRNKKKSRISLNPFFFFGSWFEAFRCI